MEKKNTILLTVIAVATLLVAVVGASFAFFAVQETNTAQVNVSAQTAEGSDVFSATGSGSLALNVTNDVMMQTGANLGDVAVSATDSNMKVSLTAGTGKATCTYKLTYTSTGDAYTKTSGAVNEYTLTGSAGTGLSFEETNMDAVNTFGPYTITNTAGTAATVQTWTFTAKFYNLDADQKLQMNKKYAGNVKVTDVVCTNEATAQ